MFFALVTLVSVNAAMIYSMTNGPSCRNPFKPVHGVCLFWNASHRVSWCDAQEFCGRFEGELVTGENAIRLNRKKIGTVRYFIGLTDLLNERRKSRSGWRWTDGSLEPSSGNLNWARTDPDNYKNRADYVGERQRRWGKTGRFGDGVKVPDKLRSPIPMCQPRKGLSSTWRTRRSGRFRETRVAVFSEKVEYAADGGCTRDVDEVKSAMRCSLECLGEKYDWCVAFYYHAASKLCKIVQYTDQSIDVGDGVGWRKFVRQ